MTGFDSNRLLEAHYRCEYDFARARLYSGCMDLSKVQQYCSLPMPGPGLEIDSGPIAALFIAGTRDGQRELLDKAVAVVEAIYALPNWRYPHHQHMNQVDLGMAVVSARLGQVYGEIGGIPGLGGVRERLAQQVISRGLEPFYEQASSPHRPGWARMYMNWRAYICADMGRATLCLADRYPRWRDCIAEAIRGCLAVADTGCEDGGWEEGVGYWGMAFGQMANFAEELYAASAGCVNLFSHPYFRVAGDFGLYCSMPGGRATYAFSDWSVQRPRRDLMQSLAWHFANPHLQWCADQSDEPLPCLYGPAPAAVAPDSLPACKHFRGIDVAILRSGWSEKDAVVGFKCGPRRIQCHHHLDAGSIVLFSGADALLDEVHDCSAEDCADLYAQLGYPPDRAAADTALGSAATIAHSTLLADGQGQLQGRNEWGQIVPTYRTRGAVPLAHGELLPQDCSARIVAFGELAELPFVMGEAADSYPMALRAFCRTVLMPSSRQVLIVDAIRMADQVEICSLLHTPGAVESCSQGAFQIRSGAAVATLRITAASSAQVPLRSRALSWNLRQGTQRNVISAQVAPPAGWTWLVYAFSMSELPEPIEVLSADAGSLVLGADGWGQPVRITTAGWYAVERLP